MLRAYRRSRYRLLLWGEICFGGLTLNNGLVMIDRLLLLPEVNLFTWRLIVTLAALLVFLYGIIWDAE